MSVREYFLKLTQLDRYAPHVVANNSSRMSKFMSGVFDCMVKKCRTAMVIKEINLSRLMVHAQ